MKMKLCQIHDLIDVVTVIHLSPADVIQDIVDKGTVGLPVCTAIVGAWILLRSVC